MGSTVLGGVEGQSWSVAREEEVREALIGIIGRLEALQVREAAREVKEEERLADLERRVAVLEERRALV